MISSDQPMLPRVTKRLMTLAIMSRQMQPKHSNVKTRMARPAVAPNPLIGHCPSRGEAAR